MTPDPQCCTAEQTLNDVAKMMVENDCGEIPVADGDKQLVGVVTDRDIVCRVVAEGRDASSVTAGDIMSQPVISVLVESSLEAVMAKMEEHQIRRVPVVDAKGVCCGIISQADVARKAQEKNTPAIACAVSRSTSTPTRSARARGPAVTRRSSRRSSAPRGPCGLPPRRTVR